MKASALRVHALPGMNLRRHHHERETVFPAFPERAAFAETMIILFDCLIKVEN